MSGTTSRKTEANSLLIYLDAGSKLSLQDQIRQKIFEAIQSGVFAPGRRLPSSRSLARQLGVARNTVTLAYQKLIAEGHLVSRERSGIYVNEETLALRALNDKVAGRSAPAEAAEWQTRIKVKAPPFLGYKSPPDWHRYRYPFIEDYFDRSLFPITGWREASRLAFGVRQIEQWSTDTGAADDEMLVEEIRTKILPRRGIHASSGEILITAGAQQALYLLTKLFVDERTVAGVEEPGYPDMRHLLARQGVDILGQLIDENGVVVDEALNRCDLVYVTPSRQRPTGITMSMERRHALLQKAAEANFFIIEDDYECDANYLGSALPALRSLDGGDRVIYVAGFPQVLSPGLRLGFMVAAPKVISEARRLRHLMTRQPPRNNQRAAAFFLSLGHYDAMILRLKHVFQDRLLALRDALNHYLPRSITVAPVRGGTALWINGPPELDATDLAHAAQLRGILIEPVRHYYAVETFPRNIFRMAITSIPIDRIRSGVEALAALIREMTGERDLAAQIQTRAWLSERELKQRLPGTTLLYKTVYGDPCTIFLSPDGTMLGRAGYANEDRDQGRWWVENGLWCRRWDNWAYGEVSRFLTQIEGDRIKWFNEEGREVDEAVIVLADPSETPSHQPC